MLTPRRPSARVSTLQARVLSPRGFAWENAEVEIRPADERPELKYAPGSNPGLQLAIWDWEGAGPPLLFVHATSFHGRLWDQIIRLLPGRRALAVEMRGHGRSSRSEPPYRWSLLGPDLVAVLEHLRLRDVVAIGHSMGGYAVARAAYRRPDLFARLVLVDPTIFPPEMYGRPPYDVSFIQRRRAAWNSPDEMFERFHGREPFANWKPEILRDYCEFGLLRNGNGFVLACPPELEASVYMNSVSSESDPYPEIPQIRQKVILIRAGITRRPEHFDLAASPTAADLAGKFQNAREVVLEERSHYIPMECPELVAEEVRRSIDR